MRRVVLAVVILVALPFGARQARAQEGGARRTEEPASPPARPQLTRPPELLEAPAPTYPEPARAAGKTASVDVRLSVDATGAVTKVVVTTPKGDGFDEAATAAAEQYKFRPAEFDGKPGAIVIETTIHFTLTVAEPEPEPEPAAGEGGDAALPAGTARVRGTVLERGTRRKLAGAAVVVRGPLPLTTGPPGAATAAEPAPPTSRDYETETGGDGAFVLPERLPAGRYRVLVVLPGYERLRADLTLEDNEDTQVALYLMPEGGNPYETTVRAERDKLEVTRRTLERRELTTVPGTFGDPLRVIQNLPGMARAPYILGVLLIRGSGAQDSGVYVDGHKVPLLYHFLGGPSILNPEFLDTIDLYPGGFPVRFGRNSGGVVDVATRKPENDGFHGSADIDLLDTSVYLRAPLGDKVTLAVAGRRSYIDGILALADLGTLVAPVYWDYQARLDVDLPGRESLSFMFFGSDDFLRVLGTGENAVDIDTAIGFHRLRATYSTPLTNDLTLSISPSFGYDAVRFDAGEDTSADVTQRVVGLRERVTGRLAKWLRLDAGFDLEYRINFYSLTLPIVTDVRTFGDVEVDPSLLERAVDYWGLGTWLELAMDLPHGLRVIPGVRTDLYLLGGEQRLSFDPRLVVRWQADKKTAYKGYVGLFHQPPQPEGFDAEFGNPRLGLEQAWHVGVGVERKLTRAISLEAELYNVQRSNESTFSNAVDRDEDGSIIPRYFENLGSSRSYGLELLLRHEVTRNFYGWVAYTLSRSLRTRTEDSEERLSPFDSTHNLILVGSYRLGSGWEVGLRFRGVTGRPDTPVAGATYNADEDRYEEIDGAAGSIRRPFFHQLDLRVEKTWIFKEWSLSTYLDIQNVYNAENPEATIYDYRYRDSAPIRGLPFLPTLGVKGTW